VTLLRVPVGDDAERWVTRRGCRRVLVVIHNVTSATRLLDVLPLLIGDPRLQVLATCTGSSPFLAGVPDLLESMGLPVLPWDQAKTIPADLAITASYGGQLGRIRGKLAVLSHGVGYNKRLRAPSTEHRAPSTEHRAPSTEHRAPSTEHRAPVFGLSPEWLLEDGQPVATATVLSHPEQLERLGAACPEVVPTAVLAGDPCYDRIRAAMPYRERFRRALGIAPGQRLLLLSSTWSPHSLFGNGGDGDPLLWLFPRLASELPTDEYRAVAVLHPNIWHGHGPGQVRAWLDRARRAGLTLISPMEGWRQALIAADCVIGDHGSVTYYAASIGRPLLLGLFPEADLDPGSPVAALGRTAPRLRLHGGLRAQVDHVIETHDARRYAELAALTTSVPGQSAALLRRLFYDLIGIPEPTDRPALLDRLPLPGYEPGQRTAPVRVLTRLVSADPPEIAVTRYPDADHEPEEGNEDADGVHTVVHEETQDASRLTIADVIVRYAQADDPRIGPPTAWTAEVLARHPHCGLAAYVTAPDRCTVRTRAGELVELTAAPDERGRADLCDPAAYASALFAWTGSGMSLSEAVAAGMTVVTGTSRHQVTVEPDIEHRRHSSPSSPNLAVSRATADQSPDSS
jgi:hypothetical protein